MKPIWRWGLVTVSVLLLLAFSVLSYLMGGPRDVYGFLRYGAFGVHQGDLQVGDAAPDVELVALDGQTRFRLRQRLGARPLVLIFGSYT